MTFCGLAGRAVSLSMTTFLGGGGLPEMVIHFGAIGCGGASRKTNGSGVAA